jgi:LmbE family N-acetylglucosaminyl deacetylase
MAIGELTHRKVANVQLDATKAWKIDVCDVENAHHRLSICLTAATMNGTERADGSPRYTLVSFHAHPDDEVLLTGGTLARVAAEGHRVVLVLATAGERGLTGASASGDLGTYRMRELEQSAAALGIARIVTLGYQDSGMDEPASPIPGAFSFVPVETAAADLAKILIEEGADVLTTYDAVGGYGHRDHVQVHRVGKRAAELAHTPVVLEATVKRESIQKALRILARFGVRPGGAGAAQFDHAFSAGRDITHQVDVRRWARQKHAAMKAHASQTSGGSDIRTLAFLLRLPMPVFRLALGREWFVEVGRPASTPLLDDVFTSLRTVQS